MCRYDRLVERRAVGVRKLTVGGRLADGRDHVERVTREQLHQYVTDPGVGLLVRAAAEQRRDRPEVVNHVDHVEHDGDVHLAPARLGLDMLDLLLVAIDENDVGTLAVGVPCPRERSRA